MKYINYLLIALLIGFVASCSSGDDEGPVGPEGPEQPGGGGETFIWYAQERIAWCLDDYSVGD